MAPTSSDQPDGSQAATPLTPAETRVLEQLRQGASNKAIASQLVLSPRTVESHVSHLLAKTGCHNRCQLLLWALRERQGG